MKHANRRSDHALAKARTGTLLVLTAATLLGALLTPALADDRRDRDRHYRPPVRHRYYGPPPVVYAPPPVAYAAPPPVVYQPAPSLNVTIPLRF